MITLKNSREIERIARACQIVKEVFQEVAPNLVPGEKAERIDRLVEEGIR